MTFPRLSQFVCRIVFLTAFVAVSMYASYAGAQETPTPMAGTESGDVRDLLKKIETDEVATPTASPPEAATMPVPQVVDEAITPLPPQESLANPQQQIISPIPIDPATAIADVPAPPAGPVDENMFFDSENLTPGTRPSGEMRTGLPHNVSPELEPAAKYVVIEKNFDPGSEQAQLVAAQRAVQLGRYDAALRIYNQLYDKNKRDPNILLGRAIALQKLGQGDEAIRTYEELLELKPDNIEGQINLLGLIGERYPAVALQRLQTLSENYPNDVRVLAQTAVMQARFGQYDQALSSLGVAASLEEKNPSHVFNMAVIADRAGKKNDAIRYYEKALEIDTIYGGNRSIPRESVYERLAKLR
jgi:Flp pilus assembly protein TadD